jgi:hypothetical protein
MKWIENTPDSGCAVEALDVAGLYFLQRLRLGAELRAGILVDRQRAFAQIHQLLVEHIGADAVAAVLGLVIGERKLPVLRRGCGRGEQRRAEQHGGQKRGYASDGHEIPPQELRPAVGRVYCPLQRAFSRLKRVTEPLCCQSHKGVAPQPAA